MAITLADRDWRFTELVMRSWSEQDLTALEDTARHHEAHVLIEDLDHPAPVCAPWSYCG